MSTNVVRTSRINKTAIDQILNLVTTPKTEYVKWRLKRNVNERVVGRDFSNLCKINKQPWISVNARVFCLKKKDAIEPGMKLFIVPSFFFYKSRRHDKWKILSQESKV